MKPIFKILPALVSVMMLMGCGGAKTGEEIPLDEFTNQSGQKAEGRVITVNSGDELKAEGEYKNFILKGSATIRDNGEARLRFDKGYEAVFHNGGIDGTRKTGSLATVRNLYRSLAEEGEPFDFEIAVRGKNIAIKIKGVDVVCYTEPEHPYRTPENADKLIGEGPITLIGKKGTAEFRDLRITPLSASVKNPNDTMPPIDERKDEIIRLQQRNFPVIDWHVHLKGGLTKEMAHAMSMNYGINYGICPNLGEGGVGRMLSDDEEAYAYYEEVKDMPFLRGAQGEGRRWSQVFSQKALNTFDYLFTDAMTIVDQNHKISRIYHPEEINRKGMTMDQYMDILVSQIVKILTYEPVDIYANATYIPDDMQDDYDKYWTDARINRVLDVLQKYKIAMEISPRYRIPSTKIISMAKARGIKFTFGTNNVDARFGKLEYALKAIKVCKLTADDMWFPPMSIRKTRHATDYNHFGRQ